MHVDLAVFSDRYVRHPEIRALVERTAIEADEGVRRDSEFSAAVAVTTAEGTTRARLVPLARGKPARWMSRPDIEAKCRDCVGEILARAAADELFSLLQAPPALPDLGRVAELAPEGRPAMTDTVAVAREVHGLARIIREPHGRAPCPQPSPRRRSTLRSATCSGSATPSARPGWATSRARPSPRPCPTPAGSA